MGQVKANSALRLRFDWERRDEVFDTGGDGCPRVLGVVAWRPSGLALFQKCRGRLDREREIKSRGTTTAPQIFQIEWGLRVVTATTSIRSKLNAEHGFGGVVNQFVVILC